MLTWALFLKLNFHPPPPPKKKRKKKKNTKKKNKKKKISNCVFFILNSLQKNQQSYYSANQKLMPIPSNNYNIFVSVLSSRHFFRTMRGCLPRSPVALSSVPVKAVSVSSAALAIASFAASAAHVTPAGLSLPFLIGLPCPVRGARPWRQRFQLARPLWATPLSQPPRPRRHRSQRHRIHRVLHDQG